MRNSMLARDVTFAVLAILSVSFAYAGIQDVIIDGKEGKFKDAHSALQQLSKQLETQTTNADIMIVGRNCAALGFYAMLSQIASDCISGKLPHEHGKTLFTAAQKAVYGQLQEAASLAKSVTDANPNYTQARLLFGRILMGECMQRNKNCKKSISTYTHALKINKALIVAYFDLGMLYSKMGNNQKAIESWENAIIKSQGQTAIKWAHLNLAILYSKEEQWGPAKKHAQKAKKMGFTGIANELLADIERHSKNR